MSQDWSHWRSSFEQLDENQRVKFASHLIYHGLPSDIVCTISTASALEVGVAEVLRKCGKPPPQCTDEEKKLFYALVSHWCYKQELNSVPAEVRIYLGLDRAFEETRAIVLDHEDFGLLDLSTFPLSSQRFLRENVVPPFVVLYEVLPLLWSEHAQLMTKYHIVPTSADNLVRDFSYTVVHYPVENMYGGRDPAALQALLITTISRAIGSRFHRERRPLSTEFTSFCRFYGLGLQPASVADLASFNYKTEQKMIELLEDWRRRVQQVVWQTPELFFRVIPFLRRQSTQTWVRNLPSLSSETECTPVTLYGESWWVPFSHLHHPLLTTNLPQSFVELLGACGVETVGDLAVMSEVELWYAWESVAREHSFSQVLTLLNSFRLRTGIQIPHWLSLRYPRPQPA